MTLTQSIRSTAEERSQHASIRQMAADAGVPKSTLHDFLKGATVLSGTVDALYAWAHRNEAACGRL